METKILEQLDFNIIVPTGYHFLMRFLHRIKASDELQQRALYYAEKSLQEDNVMIYSPPLYAAAALFSALAYLDGGASIPVRSIWSPMLVDVTGYSDTDLWPCVSVILSNLEMKSETPHGRELIAVKKKFAKISSLPIPLISVRTRQEQNLFR